MWVLDLDPAGAPGVGDDFTPTDAGFQVSNANGVSISDFVSYQNAVRLVDAQGGPLDRVAATTSVTAVVMIQPDWGAYTGPNYLAPTNISLSDVYKLENNIRVQHVRNWKSSPSEDLVIGVALAQGVTALEGGDLVQRQLGEQAVDDPPEHVVSLDVGFVEVEGVCFARAARRGWWAPELLSPLRMQASRTVATFGNSAYACGVSSSSPRSSNRAGSKSTGSAASLLRSLRESQGRSLRVVAEDLGVAPSQLSRIERGQRGLGEGLPERIADYYGVSADVVALAEGRVPTDVLLILTEHPDELERLREQYQEQSAGRARSEDDERPGDSNE